ncbi:CopG family transcriptional regulator [Photorhabdus laumondii subsp. laumondii]|uniref:CopG family transcriptional regulator n=2 Tax=Photorhabdus TaxID=29487 RepID=A0A6L9JJD9_PHOLM|nr:MULTISPECIES: type II toxin-antitoxin system HicB family antitoxin [Photorhabdus]AXG43493.1 CopG family transcriptional regulator [Photorhabdus laumondii subsp. laumondii]MCC8384092.1 type II toxin-antitoxin system HicB family antitoxin [Photorhabdus laumondii]MCC8390731.1 type II toxin-antitoxin system HicB family antitoxin [Photorhabdus laumondii]MCC8412225.1 type II toxin-antitoxin system HicB family antitoxin [Photorhabdus laumondii]MCZ1248451.1 CopG family transcriptional regulator [Ph
MFFSVGVELPKNENTAHGLVIPALCAEDYGCFSAADNKEDIAIMAREAILLTVEDMVANNSAVEHIQDAGYLVYAKNTEYQYIDNWFVINVDLSEFSGKQQRINISLPDTLIQRIDNRVKESPTQYRNRSHFLAEAARHELR